MRTRVCIASFALLAGLLLVACGHGGSQEDAWDRGFARGYQAGVELELEADRADIPDAPGYIQEQADRAFWTFAMAEAAAASLMKDESACWQAYHAGYFSWFWDTFRDPNTSDAELKALDAQFQIELDEYKQKPIVIESVETMQKEGC